MSGPFDVRSADVLIVGAGPAGLSAATRLRQLGVAKVIVVDREQQGGGIPRHCGHPPFGMREFGRVLTGPAYARKLVERAVHAGVDLQLGCSVVSIDCSDGDLVVACATNRGALTVTAKRIVIATGVRERPRSARLLGGDRPLGILNTGALQEYVYLERLAPFRRPLIVGTELVALSSLLTCRKIGARPVAMIEAGSHSTVRRASMALPRLLGVPVRYETEIVDIEGRRRVEAVTVRARDGRVDTIDCDGVLLTGCFRPEAALARTAGLEIDMGSGGPAIDQFARTSEPRIFAAGNVLHPVDTAGWSWREGRKVGEFVAQDLAGKLPDPKPAIKLTAGPGIRYVVPQRLVPGEGGLANLQLRADNDVSSGLVAYEGNALIRKQALSTGPERRILTPTSAFAGARGDVTISIDGEEKTSNRSGSECV